MYYLSSKYAAVRSGQNHEMNELDLLFRNFNLLYLLSWMQADTSIFNPWGSWSKKSTIRFIFDLLEYSRFFLHCIYKSRGNTQSPWMLLRIEIFSFRAAFYQSWLASIEVREPFINEKEMTPITIIKEQNILSMVFVPLMSPYPMVVMVVIVQYTERL